MDPFTLIMFADVGWS